MDTQYVHGYHARENERLDAQATTLTELLQGDIEFPAGSTVLEVGCGVGSQTIPLARRSPAASFVSIDISEGSVIEAARRVQQAGLNNVVVRHADVFSLPFAEESFDHVFVCFVLEHIPEPASVLNQLRSLLRTGGTMTTIEGDHGSTYFSPESAKARAAIQCQVDLQRHAGGDALIGRRLYPLMVEAGYRDVCVTPRMVYADASRTALVDGFTTKTFIAMIEGVREAALAAALTDADKFDDGIADLRRTTEKDGVFCYTFFRGLGFK